MRSLSTTPITANQTRASRYVRWRPARYMRSEEGQDMLRRTSPRSVDRPRLCQADQTSVSQPPEGELAVMVTSDRCDVAITPDLLLPELFRLHPETRIVFDRHGLRGCGGPSGPHESIRFFARAHGVDEPTLLRELQQATAAPRSLPAVPPQRARFRRLPIRSTVVTSWPGSQSCSRPGRPGVPGCSGRSA